MFFFFFLNTWRPVCTPKFSLVFPVSLRKTTRHFLFLHGVNVSEKYLTSVKPWHGRPDQWLYSKCFSCAMRNLASAYSMWVPQSGWVTGRTAVAGSGWPQTSDQLALSAAKLCKIFWSISCPERGIYSSVGDIKEPTSFLAHCITPNTFPSMKKHPHCLKGK